MREDPYMHSVFLHTHTLNYYIRTVPMTGQGEQVENLINALRCPQWSLSLLALRSLYNVHASSYNNFINWVTNWLIGKETKSISNHRMVDEWLTKFCDQVGSSYVWSLRTLLYWSIYIDWTSHWQKERKKTKVEILNEVYSNWS